MDYKSSLLLCSIPRWVLIEVYLTVPVRLFPSLYAICWCVLVSLNFLLKPKSIRYNVSEFSLVPIKKFSGFMSRWRKLWEWRTYILLIIWMASMQMVFTVNFFLHIRNRSYRLGPNISITMKFDLFSFPYQMTLGNPFLPWRDFKRRA